MKKLLLLAGFTFVSWAQNTSRIDIVPTRTTQGRIQFKGDGTGSPTAPTGNSVNVFQRNGKLLCKDSSGADCWSVTNAAGTDVPIANISGSLVSVKDYGAVGDGSTDDTTAITNAIAANPSIYFPCGSYKITSKISLSSNKTIQGCAPANHWRGDSGTKIVYYGTDRAIEIKPPNSTGYDTINILDMEINGDNATSTARGLVIDGSNSSAYVEGVYTSGLTIKNFPGYQLYGTGLIFMLSFHNSSFFNISRTSGEHVVYFGDNQYRSQVYFYDCTLGQYTVGKWAFWEELGTGTNFSGGTVFMAGLSGSNGSHGIRANGGLNVWGTSVEGLPGATSSQTGIKYTGTNGGLISATIISNAIGIEIGDGTNKTAAAEGLTIAGTVGNNVTDVYIWDGGSRTATQIIQIGRPDATPIVINARATTDGVYTDVLYFNMGGSGLNLGGMPLITTGTVSTGGLSPTTVTASQAITSADNITGLRLESTTGILRAPTTTPLLVDNNAQTQNKVNLVVRSWSSQTNPFLSLQDSSGVEKARWNIDGSLQIIGVTYANLPTPSNGQLVYCTDCQQANPCASGGSGAFARREAGAWNCAGSGGGGGGGTITAVNSGTGMIASTVGTTVTVNVDTATVPTYIAGSTSIDFGSISQSACSTSNITVTGAVTGDTIAPGWPATLEAGLIGTMSVTAANTVTVTLCKITTGAVDPANNTFKATVVRSF